MTIGLKYARGMAQIPLLIGLLIMAIAVPVATNLVQQNQENRGRAYTGQVCVDPGECGPGETCENGYCVGIYNTPVPTASCTPSTDCGACFLTGQNECRMNCQDHCGKIWTATCSSPGPGECGSGPTPTSSTCGNRNQICCGNSCNSGLTCYGGNCIVPGCTNPTGSQGDLHCLGGSDYNQCSDGSWIGGACGNGMICPAGKSACEMLSTTTRCTPGETRCKAGMGYEVERCDGSGNWVYDDNCQSQNQYCISDVVNKKANCGGCVHSGTYIANGETRCFNALFGVYSENIRCVSDGITSVVGKYTGANCTTDRSGGCPSGQYCDDQCLLGDKQFSGTCTIPIGGGVGKCCGPIDWLSSIPTPMSGGCVIGDIRCGSGNYIYSCDAQPNGVGTYVFLGTCDVKCVNNHPTGNDYCDNGNSSPTYVPVSNCSECTVSDPVACNYICASGNNFTRNGKVICGTAGGCPVSTVTPNPNQYCNVSVKELGCAYSGNGISCKSNEIGQEWTNVTCGKVYKCASAVACGGVGECTVGQKMCDSVNKIYKECSSAATLVWINQYCSNGCDNNGCLPGGGANPTYVVNPTSGINPTGGVNPTTPPGGNNPTATTAPSQCTRNSSATVTDFSTWKSELMAGGFGTVQKTTWSTDYNCDGYINLVDFSVWREAFINKGGN